MRRTLNPDVDDIDFINDTYREDPFEAYADLLEELNDTEDADLVLLFSKDEEWDYGDCEAQAEEALAEYTFEELLDMNEIDETDVVTALLYNGDIGVPSQVEDEEDEDTPPEEIED